MYILKKMRDEHGLSQEEVAEKIDISVKTLQKWENGSCRPRDVNKLDSLLTLYNMNALKKAEIIQRIYGCEVEKIEQQLMRNPLKNAVYVMEKEKDVQYYIPYPLDKMVTLLTIINDRMDCLDTTIRYCDSILNKHRLTILGIQTAILIDYICDEYQINIGAMGAYKMDENAEKVDAVFYGNIIPDMNIYIDEFGKKMSYKQYYNALSSNITIEPFLNENLLEALTLMKKDWIDLSLIRENILTNICCENGWEEGVDVSAYVDVNAMIFFENVTVYGMSFFKISTPKRMEWFLNSEKSNIYVDKHCIQHDDVNIFSKANYVSLSTVNLAVSAWKKTNHIEVEEEPHYSRTEWIEYCQSSDMLKYFVDEL